MPRLEPPSCRDALARRNRRQAQVLTSAPRAALAVTRGGAKLFTCRTWRMSSTWTYGESSGCAAAGRRRKGPSCSTPCATRHRNQTGERNMDVH